MNRLFNRNRMLIILFGIIILILLIGFSMTDRSSTTRAEQFTADAAAGSQMIINAPFDFVGSLFGTITRSFNAVEENEKLRAQLEMLPQMQADIERLEAENEELREALDISSRQSYESINARVISRSHDQWLNSFTIDKGETDGLTTGMAVMTPEGLIGTVTRVNGGTSYVEMLTTSVSQNNLSVEVMHDGTPIYGNVQKYDKERNLLVVENIKNRSGLSPGDEVFTSGLVGNYPEGLLIGTVVEVENDEYGLSQNAYVQLKSNADNVDVVFVIERSPESMED
ncbi:rod shape-determining protein MreC [Salinicoccus sp. ID82-1]|uniref:Cell shape-determining protein MreC n=1 Tax=Salinicoccus cyprini TaxID=2493691 RepID=A0A558AYK0_9STAP|nr:rod shape-determining protein MreC [Salinicoccus cyprini]MCG1008851.1 rod shape-determining protein MreC [Salinicoccus sp. ID82-1]TVT29314.1 rod shape-determining protein MreC [Salinicoccus cyprini]